MSDEREQDCYSISMFVRSPTSRWVSSVKILIDGNCARLALNKEDSGAEEAIKYNLYRAFLTVIENGSLYPRDIAQEALLKVDQILNPKDEEGPSTGQ